MHCMDLVFVSRAVIILIQHGHTLRVDRCTNSEERRDRNKGSAWEVWGEISAPRLFKRYLESG